MQTALLKGWLGTLESPLAEALMAAGQLRYFARGETIYELGDNHRCLWSIASGTIRMFVGVNDQPPRFGHVGGPGFWFGEVEFMTNRPSIMEVSSGTDTEILMVRRSVFDNLARHHPGAWRAVAELAGCNAATAIAAAEDLMIRSQRGRLAALLLRLSSHRSAFRASPPSPGFPRHRRRPRWQLTCHCRPAPICLRGSAGADCSRQNTEA